MRVAVTGRIGRSAAVRVARERSVATRRLARLQAAHRSGSDDACARGHAGDETPGGTVPFVRSPRGGADGGAPARAAGDGCCSASRSPCSGSARLLPRSACTRCGRRAAATRRGPVDAIVVMGAAQYDGEPSPQLAARLDHVVELWPQGTRRSSSSRAASARGPVHGGAGIGRLPDRARRAGRRDRAGGPGHEQLRVARGRQRDCSSSAVSTRC